MSTTILGRLALSHFGAEAQAHAFSGQWDKMNGPYSRLIGAASLHFAAPAVLGFRSRRPCDEQVGLSASRAFVSEPGAVAMGSSIQVALRSGHYRSPF